MSGSPLPPADVATLSGYSSFGYTVSLTWFLCPALYASTSAFVWDSVPARVHIVMVVPSSGPAVEPDPGVSLLPQAAVAVIAKMAARAATAVRKRWCAGAVMRLRPPDSWHGYWSDPGRGGLRRRARSWT